MKILSLIRPGPPYRSDAFRSGLESCGHRLTDSPNADALLIWNRYGRSHQLAQAFERSGRPVLVAENGYMGREWLGSTWYAISRNWHNRPYEGPVRRTWARNGGLLLPWRGDGGRIVILAQRGIGTAPVAQPRNWVELAQRELQRRTRREVVVRTHPGNRAEPVPLIKALEGAWACVTWASGAAMKAITLGVPVFHGLSPWVGGAAARPFSHDIEDPYLGDRAPMLDRMMQTLWSVDEIARGEPFRDL